MISQTAEYALRAAVYLARFPSRSLTTRQIAAKSRVPASYLAKVMQALSRAGIVQSRRGLHGGFVLRRSSADISILDIVNAVDPIKRIHSCPLGLSKHGSDLCPLHRKLDEASALVEEKLRDCTIADVLSRRVRSQPLDLPRMR